MNVFTYLYEDYVNKKKIYMNKMDFSINLAKWLSNTSVKDENQWTK